MKIVVTNKLTYLFLLSVPVGIIKIIYDYITLSKQENFMSQFAFETFISLIILILGVVAFIKLNTYSAYLNPNHPKEKSGNK